MGTKCKHDTVILGRQEPAEIKFALIKKPARHDDVISRFPKVTPETKSTVDDWNKYAKHETTKI